MRKVLLDIHEILGEELLAKLIGRKPAVLRKLLKSPNQIPPSIEDKLNFLIAIIRNLKGSYNYYGIRGWFQRERIQLRNKRPIDLLSKNWWPRDPEVLEILILSSDLKR